MSGSNTLGQSPWQAFWNRGRWWKAFVAAIAYLALYLGAGQLVGVVFGDEVAGKELFDSPLVVFLVLILPLLIGAIGLSLFVYSVGWFRTLFGPQPIRGHWWMWIAVVVVALPILLRLVGIDYAAYEPSVVLSVFLAGLLIGFTEELITRGIAVKILRDAGHSEWVVAAVSSLIFALLHISNAFSGQPVGVVAVTVAYTFFFGVLMYLTMRVTGSLIWPMILHGLTDPTAILAAGGIDTTSGGASNVFLTLAAPANMITIVVGLVLLIFIRGRVATASEFAKTPVLK